MKCADCKWWRAVTNTPDGSDRSTEGQCRRYAPRPLLNGAIPDASTSIYAIRRVAWPLTDRTDFCGDFYVAREPVF
jgi:hypothetical protein